MKFSDSSSNKATLCQEISRLRDEVNNLALELCASETPEVNYIWNNLANARAFLATALEAARELKKNKLENAPDPGEIKFN